MMAKKSKPTRREFVLMNKNTPFQYQEAYKSLRTNLNFMAMGKACKKLIFTSAIPGEGKSSVALNLAVSLAETGSRVLVIDCDLRKPVIHRYLNRQFCLQGDNQCSCGWLFGRIYHQHEGPRPACNGRGCDSTEPGRIAGVSSNEEPD